jgi:isoleucyl-tRNA synthetase
MKLAPEQYTVLESFPGSTLAGLAYTHPFDAVTDKYKKFKEEMPRVHTVLLNSDFVTTEVGTGLVHVAPGCGSFRDISHIILRAWSNIMLRQWSY